MLFLLGLPLTVDGLPCGSEGKASVYDVGDLGSIPGSGRSSGEGNGNPFQYSCLENPVDGGAWWAACYPWGHRESDNLYVRIFKQKTQEWASSIIVCLYNPVV